MNYADVLLAYYKSCYFENYLTKNPQSIYTFKKIFKLLDKPGLYHLFIVKNLLAFRLFPVEERQGSSGTERDLVNKLGVRAVLTLNHKLLHGNMQNNLPLDNTRQFLCIFFAPGQILISCYGVSLSRKVILITLCQYQKLNKELLSRFLTRHFLGLGELQCLHEINCWFVSGSLKCTQISIIVTTGNLHVFQTEHISIVARFWSTFRHSRQNQLRKPNRSSCSVVNLPLLKYAIQFLTVAYEGH